ncbi:hypothetical protein D3C79_980600 [compost metagenome]
MSFDVRDRLWVNTSHGECICDYLGLTLRTWRGKSRLQPTVIIYCRATNNSIYIVAIGFSLLQPFQRHNANTVAWHCPLRLAVECAAKAVR